MLTPEDALERLEDGNRRFVSAGARSAELDGPDRRRRLVAGQVPFAAILGCADSRVPPELLFDQGFGDLFVLRVAGAVAMQSQIASIEFAVVSFSTPLVLVLGHSGCGAVRTAIETRDGTIDPGSPHLRSLVDFLGPSLEEGPSERARPLAERVDIGVARSVRANVSRLREESEILRNAIDAGRLRLVGGVYSLETGRVDFRLT